jgi:hypothetical protein
MPRTISTVYTGRQVDLLFLDIPTLTTSPQAVPLSFGIPRIIAGIQKSTQAFVDLLYTVIGTCWNPNLGCNFLAAAQTGLIRTEIDARNYFSSAVPGVLTQVNKNKTLADEILTSVTLQSVSVAYNKMTLTIYVLTAAGVGATFLVPVPSL